MLKSLQAILSIEPTRPNSASIKLHNVFVALACRHNDGQMKLTFVTGPNQRYDYHIDCGEEVRYLGCLHHSACYVFNGSITVKLAGASADGGEKQIDMRHCQSFIIMCSIFLSPVVSADTR